MPTWIVYLSLLRPNITFALKDQCLASEREMRDLHSPTGRGVGQPAINWMHRTAKRKTPRTVPTVHTLEHGTRTGTRGTCVV